MRRTGFLAASAAAAVLVAGCSSTASLARSDVEAEVRTGIASQIDLDPGKVSVTCPGDLEATVGNTMTCTVATEDDRGDVLITITSVDGTEVGFDWQVDATGS